MDAAVDAVVVIDHAGSIVAFNRSAERLFGYSVAEILGQNVSVLMPQPYREAHDDYLERYERTGIPHIIGVGREVEALRKDGTSFPAFLSVGKVGGVEPPRFVGFVRDVTTERQALATIQAERDRAQARQKEEATARRLQERMTHVSRMATMGEMAAGIAHELNQPLSAIATYARAAERFLQADPPDMEETLAALREIGSEALRAGEIIKRLRQLVGGRPTRHEATDLNSVVSDLGVLAQADGRVHKTQIEFELAPGLPPVSGDRIQLQQMILTLVRNALEALSESPIADRRISVRTGRLPDGRIELAVCDNGPGVAPEMIDRLFIPFTTSKPSGTGLGLAISQTIAQAHRGTIGHRPMSPSGACFFVRLPAIEDLA